MKLFGFEIQYRDSLGDVLKDYVQSIEALLNVVDVPQELGSVIGSLSARGVSCIEFAKYEQKVHPISEQPMDVIPTSPNANTACIAISTSEEERPEDFMSLFMRVIDDLHSAVNPSPIAANYQSQSAYAAACRAIESNHEIFVNTTMTSIITHDEARKIIVKQLGKETYDNMVGCFAENKASAESHVDDAAHSAYFNAMHSSGHVALDAGRVDALREEIMRLLGEHNHSDFNEDGAQ